MTSSTAAAIPLKGHSGAVLSIETDARGHHFVRKRAADADRNERLRWQSQKQKEARARGASCPAVLMEGELDGCFYFDMEYLPSISVAQIQIDSTPFDRTAFYVFVEAALQKLRESASGTIPQQRFVAKIDQVYQRCEAVELLGDFLPTIETVALALRAFDWSGIPASDCHGDMTLENILVSSRKEFFLIDYDQVDLGSYYLDAAKIFQDLSGHWCLRDLSMAQGRKAELYNAMLNLDGLRQGLEKRLAAADPALLKKLPQMVGLHLLRVLPYCTRAESAVFTVSRLKQLILNV